VEARRDYGGALMLRPALLGVLLALMFPATAAADVTANAPSDEASAVQGTSVAFDGTAPADATLNLIVSRSSAVDTDGVLSDQPETSLMFASDTGTWSGTWSTPSSGSFYWQVRESGCMTGTCATPPRLLVITADPAMVRPAPKLLRPAAGARVVFGSSVGFESSDTYASKMLYEVATSPAFAPALWARTTQYGGAAAFKPSTAGVYYWHAVRQTCLFAQEFNAALQLIDVDCVSRSASETRSFTVVLPAAKLSLGASGLTYRRGSIDFDLKCANPPCRVRVTGTFAGKGTRRLPALSRTVPLRNSRLTFRALRPSRREQRRIAALVERRGKVRLIIRAKSTDDYGQHAADTRRIYLHKPKPPKPKDPAQRAAERAVGLRVAEYYQLGEDRTSASCHRARSHDWKCTWDTDGIKEPWGQHCWYNGEADADLHAGYWDIRLYDFEDSCYDI
jgi:hypothetical protein